MQAFFIGMGVNVSCAKSARLAAGLFRLTTDDADIMASAVGSLIFFRSQVALFEVIGSM